MTGRLFRSACLGVAGLVLATAASPAAAGGGHGYGYGHYHGGGGDDWVYGLVGGLIGLGLGIALTSAYTAPRPVYAPPPPAYAPPSSYVPPTSYAPPVFQESPSYLSASTRVSTSSSAALYHQPATAAEGVIEAVPTSPIYVSNSGLYCREFRASGVFGGVARPIVGTACEGADGVWRVVR